jgi:hypothetical protein
MWLHADGSLSWARCGRSNSCGNCARLSAIENALVLELDAREGTPPTLIATLTTVAPKTDDGDLRRSIEQVTKALRRRWSDVEYLCFIEWTTGRAARAGGHRRVHAHELLKGIPEVEFERAEEIVRDVWRARTGAHRVEVRPLHSAGGATAYLANHHAKRGQGPTPGWHGKRFRPSRGYFGRPGTLPLLRERARAVLADRRRWRSVEERVELVLLAEGAAAESVDLVETSEGEFVQRRTVHVYDGGLWDDMIEHYAYETRQVGALKAPVLVRVKHRDVVDRGTGELRREVVEVLGPLRASDVMGRLAA